MGNKLGSLVHGSQQVVNSGDSISVDADGFGILPCDTDQGPDALLDLTDPLAPTVIEAGLYAVTATALSGVATTPGAVWALTLHLDLDGADAHAGMQTNGHEGLPGATATVVWDCPAGAVVSPRIVNFDSAARLFNLDSLIVQRLG